jgi:hypothetical protein
VSEHRSEVTELLIAAMALVAVAAGCEVMKADPVTGMGGRDAGPGGFDDAGNFVPQDER